MKSKSATDIDTLSLDQYDYKALETLKTLTALAKVQDKASARAILDKYLADENTRTARFWEPSYTLGTLLGAAHGKNICNSCDNSELPTNLFMPFGLFYTHGVVGAQLHLVDLGQYTSFKEKDNTDTEESTKWRDAIAPGLSIFMRMRKYPLSLGVDYTYKSANGVNTNSGYQIRGFVAMDIQLFNLN